MLSKYIYVHPTFSVVVFVCDIGTALLLSTTTTTTTTAAAQPNQNQSYDSPSRIFPFLFLFILILLSSLSICLFNWFAFIQSLSVSFSAPTIHLLESFAHWFGVYALYAIAASFSSTLFLSVCVFFFIYIVRRTPTMSIRTMHNKHTLNETISCTIYNLKKRERKKNNHYYYYERK